MLKNYFKISLRHIQKEGLYSVIKIFGLAIGLAACFTIGLFVLEDLSFDGLHSKKNRIVRVITIDSAQGVESSEVGVSQPALGAAAVAELPEIENYVRILSSDDMRVRQGDEEFKIEQGIFAESSFFEVFDFKIIHGQKEGVLDEPNTVVLTASEAKKLFGDQDPIGQSLQLGEIELNIKAVMEDPPKNSHLQFDVVRSLVAPEDNPGWQQFLTTWNSLSVHNYLLLNQEYEDLGPLTQKLVELKTKNEVAEYFTPTLQPLNDVHLRSKHIIFERNFAKTDIKNIYIMSSIGIIVLILACVNFINLVTAKAPSRAREVGVRKVMGGMQRQLIIQHLLETLILVTVAFVIALLITSSGIPLLNNLYGRSAELSLVQSGEMILITGIFLLFLVLVAGFYPAFVLSGFKPAQVLKGVFMRGSQGALLRQVLVVFQFAISIALIVGAGIIYQQMSYIMSRDMGYDRERVVNFSLDGHMMPQLQQFRNELKNLPFITHVGTSSARIGQQLGRNSIDPEGATEDDNYITSVMSIDDSYIPTMDMEIIQGRNFSKDFPADSASSLLINESLAEMLGWEDAIGKIINLNTGPDGEATPFSVVGVVKDFNFATVQHAIEPLYFGYNANNSVVSVKLAGDDLKEEISNLESAWRSVYPESMFEYTFLDESFQELYTNEKAFSKMFAHLTVLAMFIAIIGLFGLSAYSAQQKTKEIGIRKVLGATVPQIITLLSRDFLLLVLISFVISVPIAWMGMNQWLDTFVYRINIGIWVFVASMASALLVAFLTVCWHSIDVALTNPAVSLRDE